MKHFIIVLVVGMLTLAIMLLLYRPEVMEDVWLWLIGLIGTIIGAFKKMIEGLQKYFKKLDPNP